MKIISACIAWYLGIVMAFGLEGKKFDETIKEGMEKLKIPGVSITLISQGTIQESKGYGFSNLEHFIQATPETSYAIASLTKQFIVVGMILLEQDGKLRIEDKVSKYLDGLPQSWKDITFHHLLSHTSGIIDVENDLPSHADTLRMLRQEYSDDELLALATSRPLNFAPGDRYSYSNTGYFLCGLVIQKVTGLHWGEFLKQRIFDPLGMNDTRVNRLSEIVPNRASGYYLQGETVVNGPHTSPSMMAYAAGGLRSTVEDLARYDLALSAGKVIRLKHLERLWTPVQRNDGGYNTYGYGWGVTTRNGQRVISHSGARESGYMAYYIKYPDKGVSVILLCNLFTFERWKEFRDWAYSVADLAVMEQ